VITGAFIPLRPWCISLCFRFPPIFEKISDSEGNFHNFTFSRKISWFSSAELSDDLFLVIDHKFWISPYFPCFSTFPLLFPENYYFPPYFDKLPPVLDKFTCFLHTLRVFRFPLLWPWYIYASPNARTGRPRVIINASWKRWVYDLVWMT